MRVKQREPDLYRFAALPFASCLALRQVLAFVRRPCWLELVFDEIIRDPGALKIQGVVVSLRFREGESVDSGLGETVTRDLARQVHSGDGPAVAVLRLP